MNHPEAEQIAAFAEGTLSGDELTAMSGHLAECPECRAILGETMQFLRETGQRSSPRNRTPWLAAAAAVIVIAGGAFWMLGTRSPLEQLIAAAPRDVRFIEPRLTGFPAAPLAPALRATDRNDPRRMAFIGTAGRILQEVGGDSSPEAVHAAGVARIVTAREESAVLSLREAAAKHSDAGIWNDLAAAQFVAAAGDPQGLLDALTAADQALKIRPEMEEALFNRALILTRLDRRDLAIEAWNLYLATARDDAWAAEARQHLEKLERAVRSTHA